MAYPTRRWVVAVAATALLALTACGGDDPTTSGPDDGSGQIGTNASASADPSATDGSNGGGNPTTGSTGGGGNTSGGGNQAPTYPSDAKSYGLEILKAIGNKDNVRLTALVDLNTVNYAQQYQNKNAQWTHTDCSSGVTATCNYYNQTGDIASVGIITSKLGQKEAGNSVVFDQSTYAKDPSSYVGNFVTAWRNASYPRMVSLSSAQIVTYVNGQTAPKLGLVSKPYPCKTSSSKTCVDAASDIAGGSPYGTIFHFIVDPTKISAGKPNGIVGYENADNDVRGPYV